MKPTIYLLFCIFLLSCNSYVRTDDFERELNENISLNEMILVQDLTKSMQTEAIMDSIGTYPYYKIFNKIQLTIDSVMTLLLDSSLSDNRASLLFNHAIISATNHFTEKSLFLEIQHSKILSLTKKDSIISNFTGKTLRAIYRNHLEIFKVQCLRELVSSTAGRCRFGRTGKDTLISSQIDSFKFSLDVLQSRDFITTFVSVDSIFRNNKKLSYTPSMKAMKYNAVLNFDTLKSGNYQIIGTVNGTKSMKYLIENKFTFEFQK